MNRQFAIAIAALVLSSSFAARADAGGDREQQIALAISAAPKSVAAKAGVYVLDKSGYVKVRESQNGFVCIVEHRVPSAVEPQCLDAEGVRTFLPRILMVGAMRAGGRPEAEIRQAVRKGFAEGKFAAPKRPGVDYMLSTHNVVTVDEDKGIAVPFPPHLMFYAPGMTNADVGSDGTPGSALFVVDEKSPHALMIVPVATDGAAAAHTHAAH
ncbi:MAG TPA: hypothetical protein VGL86_31365 [Polyangia bacterium]